MGFDKAKAVRAAEKFLAQGKIPAAIQEYNKIVEEDAADLNALNMLGDLHARINQKTEAARCFAYVARRYREQGFALKAIAMLKKVQRLQPDLLEASQELAALYEQQGLVADARVQYLTVADAYTRAGKAREALEVLRRIADLDPRNTEIRLKLADNYREAGLREQAAEAFAAAGEQFAARSDHDRALAAFTQAFNLRPQERAVLSGLLAVHSARGTPEEAAELLEQALAEQPEDRELLSMLAHAYVDAEDAAQAARVTRELIRLEPLSYERLTDAARLYLKQGEVNEAVNLIAQIVEPMLAGRAEGTLLEFLQEALRRDPEQVDALRLLTRIYTWQRDDERLRETLERLAEAAEAAGEAENEREAYAKLLRMNPDEPRYQERFVALGGSLDEVAAGVGQSYATDEVPTFESFMLTEETPAALSAEFSADESAALEAEPTAGGTVEFEWNSVESAPAPEASASFADLNDWTDDGAAAALPSDAPAELIPGASFQEFSFEPLEGQSAPDEAEAAQPTSEARREAMLAQELESVDFYLAQGYTDIARDTLDMLEAQYGAHAGIEVRRRRFAAAAPVETNDAAPQPAPETEAGAFEFSDFNPPALAEAAPEADELFGELDTAFASLAEAGPAVEAAPPPPSSGETAPAHPAIDPGLAAVFDEFRSAVEEESPPETADFETHYNLGLAYQEMELLDEAIEEFQAAAKITQPQDGTPRYLQCCNLLGHCFMRKGMPRPAAMWFKKGLDAPGHTEEEYQALRYELGAAYEQMGDLERAIDTFMEVYGINVSYRGVADRLRALQEQKSEVRGQKSV